MTPANSNAAPIQSVGYARVLAGAQSFKDAGIANVNDTYRGQIKTADGAIRHAIIKDLAQRELANEVMVAALGYAVGLPVPAAFMALAAPTVLTAGKAPRIGSEALLFASADVEAPSVAQLVIVAPGQADLQKLRPIIEILAGKQWIGGLYGFDAWAANVDRHTGNVLFAGKDGCWLIDHGRCFTGPNWTPSDLDEAAVFRHRLKEWLTPFLNQKDRERIAMQATSWVEKLKKLDLKAIGESSGLPMLVSSPDLDALVRFLEERIPHVPRSAAYALDQAWIA